MKHHEILTALTREPLLIAPASAISLLELFQLHATLDNDAFRAAREGTGMCGEKVDLAQMEIIDGIAYIPVSGPIGRGLGSFEKGAGAVDVGDITDDLDMAEEDDDCGIVLLDMDTPGGMVNGTPELADRISAMTKPVYAFSAGTIASAGYWLAAATEGIFCTKSADIGCIGVYIPWADYSEAFKKEGVKVEMFTSGKYKGMGFPGTSLSEDQRTLLKGRVEEIAAMFYQHVQMNRPGVSVESMQGQTFKGEQAMEAGLVDQVVRDKDELIDLLR